MSIDGFYQLIFKAVTSLTLGVVKWSILIKNAQKGHSEDKSRLVLKLVSVIILIRKCKCFDTKILLIACV